MKLSELNGNIFESATSDARAKEYDLPKKDVQFMWDIAVHRAKGQYPVAQCIFHNMMKSLKEIPTQQYKKNHMTPGSCKNTKTNPDNKKSLSSKIAKYKEEYPSIKYGRKH